MSANNDPRYPYTYADDYIRGLAGCNSDGMILSRANASCIIEGISEILGIPPNDLFKKIADYYLANQEMITEKQTKALMIALGYGGAE